MNQQEKHYAALAPLLALAGIFAHPAASPLLALGLFFIFYWRGMKQAQRTALRAADIAFSAQLYLIGVSLVLALYYKFDPGSAGLIRQVMVSATWAVLAWLVLSLLYGTLQALRGRTVRYPLSLRISERVFDAVRRRPDGEKS